MLIYYLFFIGITLFSFLEINFDKKVEYRIVYYLVAALLILMAGFRYKTGYDFDQYNFLFNYAKWTNYTDLLLEPGSFLIIMFSHSLGWGFPVYLFLYASAAIILKLRFFSQYSPYVFTALIVYYTIGFLTNEIGQIRHGLAIAIILVAFHYLFQENNKLFFFFCIAAIFFHISAFIVLPVYFFVNRSIKSSYLVVSVCLLSSLLFFDSRPLFISLLDIIPIPAIQAKATLYLYSEEFGSPLGLNFSFVLRIVMFLLLIAYRETGKSRFHFYDKIIWLYYYGILLYIVFNSVSEFAIRTSLYFKTLDSIILACIISFGKGRAEKNIILSLVILYAYYSMYKLLHDPVSGPSFIPYKTLFSK